MTEAFVGADGKLDATLIADYIAPDLGRGIDGEYYEYVDGVYQRDPHVLTRRIAAALGARYSTTVQKQTEAHLLNVTLPTVGVRDLPHGYLPYVVVGNGVYDWERDVFTGHDPTLGALTKLPIAYDPVATCPTFEKWLEQVLGDDTALVRHVWEVIGYTLMTGNPFHKVVLLYGPGRNGKGTLFRVIRHLLGIENYSAISLHALVEDRFAVAGLFGMIANISGDLSARFVNEPEIIKQITGGDAITCARKFGQQFTYVPYAVPLFATNEYFRSSDTTKGWRDRWEVIEFTRTVTDLGPFDERELLAEAPGILRVALWHLRKLMERGRFDPPQAAQDAAERLHSSSDPFMMWLEDDEDVYLGEDQTSPRADVYQKYSRWCRANGYQALASGPFGNRLKQLGIQSSRPRTGSSRVWHYDGIGVILRKADA